MLNRPWWTTRQSKHEASEDGTLTLPYLDYANLRELDSEMPALGHFPRITYQLFLVINCQFHRAKKARVCHPVWLASELFLPSIVMTRVAGAKTSE